MASEMSSSAHSRRLCGFHGSPESEFSIECFQNYTASEVFIQGLAGIVNQSDVEVIIRAQKQMLQRFEKTNEMLLNCYALSAVRLKPASEDFKRHIKLLVEMQKDLKYIFHKIRSIKTKILQQYKDVCNEAEVTKSCASNSKNEETEKPIKTESDQKQNDNVTVEYVQMDESADNNKATPNELIKIICSVENTINCNDSSDCTSEDTG